MDKHRVKLIGTTNGLLKMYEGLEGILMVPPLGFSPTFHPDNIRYHTLTMSWLIATEGLTLTTKNSVYVFEEVL